MSLGSFLGFVTVIFIVLSSTRKFVKIMLGKVLKRNKEKNLKKSWDLSLLLWLQKNHRYFGMASLLVALAHAALQFSITGVPSLTGATLVTLLVVQGITGYLQEKKKGNLKVLQIVHEIVPLIIFGLIILHIIFNSTFISGIGIGG
jgi:hypothetical protein